MIDNFLWGLKNIPIKGYGVDPYFREFNHFLSKNLGNFGNHPELKILGILGIVRIEVWACRVDF